ncbi:MAG TPA: hypothetical protein VGX70_09385 [Gemmataceae bacterium]|jgi:hypothetical protein|nr:hypothetical protein [Gemmataceae bacterium]
MGFDWKLFVAVSRFQYSQAVNSGIGEAFLRSALSRAYYGAFCYSRNYARDWLGFIPRYDAEDHGRLRAHLKKSKRWKVSEKLERLRDWRNECDYKDELTFDLDSAMGPALKEADYIFSSLVPPAAQS